MRVGAPRIVGRDYMLRAGSDAEPLEDGADDPLAPASRLPGVLTAEGSSADGVTMAGRGGAVAFAGTEPLASPDVRRRPAHVGRARESFAALALPDFRYLFISTISAGFGQWAQLIGMGWLAFELTGHSASQLAAVYAVGGVIRLVTAPAVGVVLDRDRDGIACESLPGAP